MRSGFEKNIKSAVDSVRRTSEARPATGVILGSGLSGIASRFPGSEISYRDIAAFPAPTVAGHRGILSLGTEVAVMAGRFHLYEGHPIDDVVLPVFLLHGLGVRRLVVTNAAGGVNEKFQPGDLVLIRDHLNLMGVNPLFGSNPEGFGPRFPDMTNAYPASLRQVAQSVAAQHGLARAAAGSSSPLSEGVYAALTGPSYETPSEVRMLRGLGADMVGMSTVPEVIVARYLGMEVLGISCITNVAAGMSGQELNHEEVVETGKRVERSLGTLVEGVCAAIRKFD